MSPSLLSKLQEFDVQTVKLLGAHLYLIVAEADPVRDSRVQSFLAKRWEGPFDLVLAANAGTIPEEAETVAFP